MMVLAFLIGMMLMIETKGGWQQTLGGASIALNLFMLIFGIFGDPGVKPATYLHYSKNWYNGKMEYTSDSDETSDKEANNDSDEESGNPRKRNHMQNRSKQRQ